MSVTHDTEGEMPPGLFRRNGRYYTRRRIPVDLTEHFGKAEIVRALGTSDAKEARIRHAKAWVALDDEFRRAKEGSSSATTASDPTQERAEVGEFDPAVFAANAFATLRRRRSEAAEAGRLSEFTAWAKDELQWQQASLEHGPIVIQG